MQEDNNLSSAEEEVINVIKAEYPDMLTPAQYKEKLAQETSFMVGADAIYNEKYYLLFIEMRHGTQEEVINVIKAEYPDMLTPVQYKEKLAQETSFMVGADAIYNEKYYRLFLEKEYGTQEAVSKLLEELNDILQ